MPSNVGVSVPIRPVGSVITGGPTGTTTATDATFTFAANDAGATFECKLDGGSFAACSSPKSYSGLAVGSHTFQVRATDALGNVESSPASSAWTIAAAGTDNSTSTPSGGTGTTGTTPQATLSALLIKVVPAKKQRAKSKALMFTVSCNAACTVNLTAFAKLGKKLTKLGTLSKALTAGKKVTLKLTLSKKVLAKLATALRSHRKGLAIQVTVGGKPMGADASKLAPAKPATLKLSLKP